MRLTNSFEGGSNGTALTGGVGGNTGGASGDFFDTITGPVTFSNTANSHGTLGVSCAAAAGEAYAMWSTQLGGTFGTLYSRIYLKNMTAAAASVKLISVLASATVGGRLNINASGQVILTDTAGTTIGAASTTVVTGRTTPVRIEFKIVGDTSVGVLEAKIFLTSDSTVADETMTRTAVNTGSTALDRVRFGPTGTAVTATAPLDDVGITDVAYMGPAVAASPAAFVPPPGYVSPPQLFRRLTPGDMSPSGVTAVGLADASAATADDLTVAAAVPLADTAAGADALTVSVALTIADTAVGADTLSASQPVTLAGDTGTGADALTATAAIPLADTGHGTDALTEAAAVPLVDTGTGVDALTIAAAVPLADTSSAVDALNVGAGSNPSLPDTATATDTLTVSVAVSLADPRTVADALAVAVPIAVSDTGLGTDTLTFTISIALSDTATGSDALTIPARTLPLADTAAGIDTLTVGTGLIVPLTVTGSDRPTTTVTSADTGSGVTGTDRSLASVSSSDRSSATVTGTDRPTSTVS